jgi:curli biogenesis system outer membrane secretion channel CsgG
MFNPNRHAAVTMLGALLVPAVLAAQSAPSDKLEKCDKPVGTLAVVEPQDEAIVALRRYSLQSPTSLIRMMVQQSNCFQVVERGAAMRNLMQERELARSGDLQQNSNIGGGQLKAADYVLTPNVLFSEGNAGGIGGALLSRSALGAIAGGLKFKEAQTSLLVVDSRSGIQVVAAEGKAKKTDFGLGLLGWTGGAVGAVGGYTNTNEGKVVAASFLDNYNQIVKDVRGKPELMKSSENSTDNKAGAVFAEGDVVAPKIDNIKVLAEPKDGSRTVGTVGKADDLVYLGEEKDGFVKVQGSSGEGWIKKALVAKK